jgi:formiminotetrahydrofolate cyclodeaminase
VSVYRNKTLREYLDCLAARTPVPGGGSAAALTAAIGIALIEMVARYSKNKDLPKEYNRKIDQIIKQAGLLHKRLLELVDLDAQAYMKVVKTRKASLQSKQNALSKARAVPKEVCLLCYRGVNLTPFLAEAGNKYLMSDVEVALELLLAAFRSSKINIRVNQS